MGSQAAKSLEELFKAPNPPGTLKLGDTFLYPTREIFFTWPIKVDFIPSCVAEAWIKTLDHPPFPTNKWPDQTAVVVGSSLNGNKPAAIIKWRGGQYFLLCKE